MDGIEAESDESESETEAELLAEFAVLWQEADDIWVKHQNDAGFQGYVSSDYQAVYESLVSLKGRVHTVLEWGSGLGVMAIMASRMGFEVCGIESESQLVDYSDDLAQKFAADVTFAVGSFIPDDFEWDPGESEVNRTVIDMPSGYHELDREVCDFDLVFAYPWPNEHELYHAIMRQFGRRDASLLLMYDAREGMNLVQF